MALRLILVIRLKNLSGAQVNGIWIPRHGLGRAPNLLGDAIWKCIGPGFADSLSPVQLHNIIIPGFFYFERVETKAGQLLTDYS